MRARALAVFLILAFVLAASCLIEGRPDDADARHAFWANVCDYGAVPDDGQPDDLAFALAFAASPRVYGRLLFDYLIPEYFDEAIGDAGSVRLIVDRTTASFPWEMACFRSRSDSGAARWLGLDRALTRQFRTMLSRPPGTTPPLNDQVRILFIADPAPEPELQLPYARREGRHVVETLRRLNRPELRIDVESRIGSGECDIVEVLALILTGGFDIVHYAGHGDYNPADPMTAGWIFGRVARAVGCL